MKTLADALARNDETAEIIEKALELRIAGGLGDAAMERKVLVDRQLAAPDGVLDAPVSLGDLFDVRAIVALGGEPRRFDLDAGAQLHDVERLAQRIQLIDFDAERPAHMLGDEGADPLPHHDQTVGAQARHRLAHHRAAHPGRGHHLLLGRQL